MLDPRPRRWTKAWTQVPPPYWRGPGWVTASINSQIPAPAFESSSGGPRHRGAERSHPCCALTQLLARGLCDIIKVVFHPYVLVTFVSQVE